MSERNPPADTIRDGNVKATIWKRQSEEGGPFFSTSFARTYRDEKGYYRDSNSFSGPDLLKVSELARTAYARTNELRREHSPDRGQDRDEGGARDDDDRSAKRESFRGRRQPRTRDRDRRDR